MNANINDDELSILAYLHECAKAFGEHGRFEPKEIMQALKLDDPNFVKHISYLVEHDLAGIKTIDVSTMQTGQKHRIIGVWLTGKGENFMRELEAQPGIARKITVASLKELGKTGRDIAVAVLTAALTHGR